MKRLAALAAILSLLPAARAGADTPPTAQGEAPGGAYVAPSGPLILTRILRRSLPDGKEIVSTRRYEVRIVPDGPGFRVDGHLLDVALEAPPSLAALADIERKRGDEGLFPFRLDPAGLIASQAAARDTAAAGQAGDAARTTITASPLRPADRALSETFVGRLVSRDTGTGAQWPADLFRPMPGRRSETRQLPGGSVTNTVEARRGTAQAPGDVIERTVTTETGGAQRITREVYKVEPRGGAG